MTDTLERVVTAIPGPRSLRLARKLAGSETRGVTYFGDDFPVFWDRASGSLVTDVDGNRYIDATSAFGVALTGHANPAVARAIAAQAERLPHAMGDVHPSELKARLCAELAARAPVDDARVYLGSSGADALEFARKTAFLATGKSRTVAFAASYHGLSYGALEIGGIAKFRSPWIGQLAGTADFVAYPRAEEDGSALRALAEVARILDEDETGAVVVEPIQGRAGVIVPPDGFLRELAVLCRERGVVLVLDEIYTGFGRTGTRFACDRDGVRPDVLCVGKALGGGFPISAAIVARECADAWAPSGGEALHTATYLGNPMACAAALANLIEMDRLDVTRLAHEREAQVGEALRAIAGRRAEVGAVRGRGLMWAVDCTNAAVANATVVRALGHGLILLQTGTGGASIAFSPPAVIDDAQLARAFALFEAAVDVPAAPSGELVRQ